MPGSRSELAVVSDTFVKIYDLAVDVICPQYCFIVMSGKVKDATFVVNKQVGGTGPGLGVAYSEHGMKWVWHEVGMA